MLYLAIFAAAFCLVTPSDASIVKRQARPCPDECEGVPLEIAFVVDGSASIWTQNFTLGLWFVQNFVDKFQISQDEVRVSMVTYGDRVYTEDAFNFDRYGDKETLNEAIDSVPYRHGQSTETGAAIAYMLDNQISQARPDVRKVAIVLTDGNSQRDKVTKAEAERAKATGLEIFAIGVGRNVTEQELHNIASDRKHVFIVGTYGMLDDILDRLAFEACGVVPKPECQFDPVDIAFVIDSSTSIGRANFTVGLQFIKEFLEVFEINPTGTRVAAIMYGDRVYAEYAIPFGSVQTEKETLDAVLALEWQHGSSTETGDGIDYMKENFVPDLRPHAAHIAIVITDGESQDKKKTAKAAEAARDADITVFAVGVGKLGESLNEKELISIAGDRSRVLTADDYGKLNTIREDLIDITCSGIASRLSNRGDQFYPS